MGIPIDGVTKDFDFEQKPLPPLILAVSPKTDLVAPAAAN